MDDAHWRDEVMVSLENSGRGLVETVSDGRDLSGEDRQDAGMVSS